MTHDHIKRVLDLYDSRLAKMDLEPHCSDGNCGSALKGLAHVRWMCQEIRVMIDRGESEDKINRWFGFIQGVLYADGIYSINEMRDHNRQPLTVDHWIAEQEYKP